METHERRRRKRASPSTATFLVSYLLSSHCTRSFVPYSQPERRVLSVVGHVRRRPTERSTATLFSNQRLDDNVDDDTALSITPHEPLSSSRRTLLQGIGTTLVASTAAPLVAHAGKAELDPKTGELFSPKADMIRGGSDAARGIRQEKEPPRLKPGQTVQTVYEPRFIVYLTRFLLTFDPPSHAWWIKQGFQDSWEQELSPLTPADQAKREARFAEFAESVEVGLADYFTGPYGSYSSVAAAKAGINAAAPAKATSVSDDRSIWEILFQRKPKKQKTQNEVIQMTKQGVLNLYALLKARYTSIAAKRQLAILFSLISSPKLQPVNEIRSLLGEADNATITKIEFDRPSTVADEARSRTSSRRGGGYSINDPPKVNIDAPPALGDSYPGPVAVPKMKPTSRILRINVIDGGAGYKSPPKVSVRQNGFRRVCDATAVLDREGRVESIIVLDPGFGYSQRGKKLPEVIIEPPGNGDKVSRAEKARRASQHDLRQAKAVAELEYEIVGIDLLDGGNGYSGSERPSISISPPQMDPDWYFSRDEMFGGELEKAAVPLKPAMARVVEMRLGDGTTLTEPIQSKPIDEGTINRIKRDPLELLPTSVRPILHTSSGGDPVFSIPTLSPMPPQVVVPSAQYRSYDPIFGGLGSVPVTMGALELSASEYARIALGGAVCTVIVRTILNPLELVKTKIQLKNDEELNNYAYKIAHKKAMNKNKEPSFSGVGSGSSVQRFETSAANGTTAIALKEPETRALAIQIEEDENPEAVELGTMDVIKSIIELRGPWALFQSADITFLASLVFGSLGFGATELFRRSFTAAFMSETGGATASTTSTLVLLAAAAVACVITSAAATPFEVLRVRSMGLVEAKPWKDVFVDYVNENRREAEKKEKSKASVASASTSTDKQDDSFLSIATSDLLPLWGGFPPTLSRELPFAIAKFLAFDLIANTLVGIVNAQAGEGALPVQVGAGTVGLVISAISGAIAGIAGAAVSHPADLILTLQSASKSGDDDDDDDDEEEKDWKAVVQEIISKDGGIANLFVGFPARASFFFMVIGLQFFLYDYVKNLFQVGSDDLSLVLDVFYAVRQGLMDMD